MTEQDLIDLGFKKEFGDNFRYYTYDFTNEFSLITQASDEIVKNNWTVEFFPLLLAGRWKRIHGQPTLQSR